MLHARITEPATLADAAGWVARHLPTHPSMPILAGALLDATNDALTICGTDTETSIRVQVPAVVDTPGKAVVSGKLLAEIAKLLPHNTMHLDVDDTALTVSCGGSTVTLPLLPIENYPSLPDLPDTCGEIDTGELATEIARVAGATSRSDDDPPICLAVAFHLPDGEEPLRLYGTDRFRLAAADLELHTGVTGGPEPGWALVPARPLETAIKALAADSTARIRIGITDDGARFGLSTEHRQVVLALLDTPVLPFEQLLTLDVAAEFTLPTRELAGALKRLALHRDAVAARLELDDNTLRITLETDAGRGEEVLPIEYTAPPVTFGFFAPRLAAAVATVTTDLAHVTVPTTIGKPWLIREVDTNGDPLAGYRHVVMPVDLVKNAASRTKTA